MSVNVEIMRDVNATITDMCVMYQYGASFPYDYAKELYGVFNVAAVDEIVNGCELDAALTCIKNSYLGADEQHFVGVRVLFQGLTNLISGLSVNDTNKNANSVLPQLTEMLNQLSEEL